MPLVDMTAFHQLGGTLMAAEISRAGAPQGSPNCWLAAETRLFAPLLSTVSTLEPGLVFCGGPAEWTETALLLWVPAIDGPTRLRQRRPLPALGRHRKLIAEFCAARDGVFSVLPGRPWVAAGAIGV